MQTELTKVNLLNTSTANDMLISGGVIKSTGLNPIRLADLISIDIRKQTSEVLQVVTIGDTNLPNITASTRYIVKVGNTRKRNEGSQDIFRTYAYTSPSILSGTPAVDRQDVYDNLTAKINADKGADWTANAGTGGTGMTITDKVGYYKGGRRGASSVFTPKNVDGSGFVQDLHLATKTSAVYSFGVGADLLEQVPVIDPITGNVIDTDQELIKESLSKAVVGQNYTGIYFTSLVRANIMANINGEVYTRHNQLLFVDDGTGVNVSNLAGYTSLLGQASTIQYSSFVSDSSALISFFRSPGVTGAVAGGPAVGAAANVYSDGSVILNYSGQGTNAVVAPAYIAGGLALFLTEAAGVNSGVEYTAPITTGAQGSYIVGQSEASFKATLSISDITAITELAVGFRIKTPTISAVLSIGTRYTDFAVLSAPLGVVSSRTRLNGAGGLTTALGFTWANTETHELEVRVALDGSVTYLIDGAVQSLAPAFKFDLGDEIVPFIYGVKATAVAQTTILKQWLSVGAIV